MNATTIRAQRIAQQNAARKTVALLTDGRRVSVVAITMDGSITTRKGNRYAPQQIVEVLGYGAEAWNTNTSAGKCRATGSCPWKGDSCDHAAVTA